MSDHFPQQLAHLLNTRTPDVMAEWDARPAAVLAPLYFHNGDWHLVFTQRTAHLKEHSGQVSFPGGGVDADDRDVIATALREAHEEIGLNPADVTVIGPLDQLLTVTQWRITPIVGLIPYPYPFTPNPDECEAVFGVPLRWLADEANLEQQVRRSPINNREVIVYYYKPWDGHIIWGATARMVQLLLRLLRQHGLYPFTHP